MIYAMKYNCESRANLYMSRCSRSFLSMTWGWSHLLQFLLGFFCPGGTPVTRESAAGTLAPWDSVCHVARWHFPKLADSLMATRWPWEVVTKKIRLKLSQWKAVWLIESYGCTYRMLKWGSRWVQHKKKLMWSHLISAMLHMSLCADLWWENLSSNGYDTMSSVSKNPFAKLFWWLIGDFYSIPLWGPTEKSQNMFGLSILLV